MICCKCKGFGLIEVLISLLVIAIGASGIVALQKTMREKSSRAEEYLVATRLVQESIDDLRAFKDRAEYSSRVASGSASVLVTDSSNLNFVNYSRLVNVNLAGGAFTGMSEAMATIDVSYSWSGLKGNAEKMEISSYISPINTFSSDDFSQVVGGGASTPLTDDSNPHSAAHVPPLYDSTAKYVTGEFVLINTAGTKKVYKCSNIHCRTNPPGVEPVNPDNDAPGWVTSRVIPPPRS